MRPPSHSNRQLAVEVEIEGAPQPQDHDALLIGEGTAPLIGVVAALAKPQAEAGISIFAISTFDTDYILVHEPDFDAAVGALIQAGHVVVSS